LSIGCIMAGMSAPGHGGQFGDIAGAGAAFRPRGGRYAYHGIFHGAYSK